MQTAVFILSTIAAVILSSDTNDCRPGGCRNCCCKRRRPNSYYVARAVVLTTTTTMPCATAESNTTSSCGSYTRSLFTELRDNERTIVAAAAISSCSVCIVECSRTDAIVAVVVTAPEADRWYLGRLLLSHRQATVEAKGMVRTNYLTGCCQRSCALGRSKKKLRDGLDRTGVKWWRYFLP